MLVDGDFRSYALVMRLGDAATAEVRRIGRRRIRWLVVAVLSGLVFVALLIGAICALVIPGYAPESGEIPAECALLVVSLSLSVLSVSRLRRLRGHEERARADCNTEDWLPPRTPRDSRDGIDADVEVRRLRTLSVRAWGLLLLWCAALVGTGVWMTALDSAETALLADGARTTGQVLSVVESDGKGAPPMRVRYTVDGVSRTAEIVRSSERHYRPLDQVTVVYNPADPDDVRTVDETDENQFVVGAFTATLLLFFPFALLSVVAAIRWRRRYRAVELTGWRAAVVTVPLDYPVRRGRHVPDLQVRFHDGSGIRLLASTSTHGSSVMLDRPSRPVQVGGAGRDMVVLFAEGRWGRRPYAVPAFAKERRRPAAGPGRS